MSKGAPSLSHRNLPWRCASMNSIFRCRGELIAERPCEPRDAARLLVVGEALEDRRRRRPAAPAAAAATCMVFNDTRVIPARLVGRRGAAQIEVTLHRDLGGGSWRAFAKGARRLQARRPHRLRRRASPPTVAAKHAEGDVTLRFRLRGRGVPRRARALRHACRCRPISSARRRAIRATARDYQTIFARARRRGRGADRRAAFHRAAAGGARRRRDRARRP